MRYQIVDGLIIDVETGEVVDTIIYELIDLQLDHYNNNSH
jgi:hypothetical protein